MNEYNGKVECGTHGKSDATFVCQHLHNGSNLGFNIGYDEENPYELYPDAWCDECDEVLNSEREWNDKSEKFSGIKLLCSSCYLDVREKNWNQDDEVFHDLICSSFRYLEEKQISFMDKYKADQHERWDWYQETGKLIFTHDGKPQVEADVHFSGSFSKKSNTWMWAWANQNLDEKVKAASRNIKAIGEKLGLKQLVAGHWGATEVDGWEMTSLLAKNLNAIGAYRTPSDNGFTYMVITKAKWINKGVISKLLGL